SGDAVKRQVRELTGAVAERDQLVLRLQGEVESAEEAREGLQSRAGADAKTIAELRANCKQYEADIKAHIARNNDLLLSLRDKLQTTLLASPNHRGVNDSMESTASGRSRDSNLWEVITLLVDEIAADQQQSAQSSAAVSALHEEYQQARRQL